jgi:uncharacterized protein (DUF2147 family)
MRIPIACRRLFFVAMTGLLAALLLAPTAWSAQAKKKAAAVARPESKAEADAATPAADADKDEPKVKIERGAGGRKVYKIEGEIVIEGKIQKPEAFYVLQKSSINYDWHELKQEFVPKILESVTKSPF